MRSTNLVSLFTCFVFVFVFFVFACSINNKFRIQLAGLIQMLAGKGSACFGYFFHNFSHFSFGFFRGIDKTAAAAAAEINKKQTRQERKSNRNIITSCKRNVKFDYSCKIADEELNTQKHKHTHIRRETALECVCGGVEERGRDARTNIEKMQKFIYADRAA